jgi:hypothetical protein
MVATMMVTADGCYKFEEMETLTVTDSNHDVEIGMNDEAI